MNIRNVIFDVGGVLLQWDPPAFIAKLHPDSATQARIRREIFEHADWHEFDRGALDLDAAVAVFGQRAGLAPEQMRALLRTANESLNPIPKPEPAIYKHLVEKTGIVPAESVFIDDLTKNVIAARECGLHAIQFRGPDDCRAALRAYLPRTKL
jgi:FMN phosphatase YigB (HAD superfamily)